MKKKEINRFSGCLLGAICEVFNKESLYYVGEIKDNAESFFYALMVTMPNLVYNKFTSESLDITETLAIAQRLAILKLNEEKEAAEKESQDFAKEIMELREKNQKLEKDLKKEKK